MSVFQNISGATARDCVIDSRVGRVIFVVNKGEMGLAIGKSGETIKKVQKVLGKGGRYAVKARLLANTYFSVEAIHIVSPQYNTKRIVVTLL